MKPSQPPARGVKAGLEQDRQAAKDGGAGYTSGVGTSAWSHDFLNKKPWHPANFKNQMRKFEAEQEVELRQKREDNAKAEFEAEQRYLDTLAHLPSKDADKYRQRQSVAWMYLKPPGLSAWEEKTQAQHNADKAKASSAAEPTANAKRAAAKQPLPSVDRSAFVAGPGGPSDALGAPWSLNVKRKERSPPRGGYTWNDDNQQFLAGGGSGEEDSPSRVALSAKRHKKERKKDRRKERRSEEKRVFKKALKLLLKEGVPVDTLRGDDEHLSRPEGT